LTSEVRLLAGAGYFIFITKTKPSRGPCKLQWVPGSHSPRVKGLQNILPPYNAGMLNEKSCASTSTVRLNEVANLFPCRWTLSFTHLFHSFIQMRTSSMCEVKWSV